MLDQRWSAFQQLVSGFTLSLLQVQTILKLAAGNGVKKVGGSSA